MVPRLTRGGARFIEKLLLIALCTLSFTASYAFQKQQVQIESTGPERKVKSQPAPAYPELALKTKMSGTARVEFTVTPDGTVKEVKEVGGNPVLLAALVTAVKQWRYEPGPRESVMEVKAAFSLN